MNVLRDVYIDTAPDGYEVVAPRDAGDPAWRWTKGAPQSAGWRQLEVVLFDSTEPVSLSDLGLGVPDDDEDDEDEPDGGELWMPADCPTMETGKIVCREAVVDVVRDALGDYGEFLPLWEWIGEQRLWLFNPLVVADVLDEERSEIYRGARSGRIMGILRWVFHEERLAQLGAFLIPQSDHLCLTGEPLRKLLAADLTGLGLECVWRSRPAGSNR